MPDVVIIDAVRTPVGRRRGGAAGMHPADLLGTALTALVERMRGRRALVSMCCGGGLGTGTLIER